MVDGAVGVVEVMVGVVGVIVGVVVGNSLVFSMTRFIFNFLPVLHRYSKAPPTYVKYYRYSQY